MRPLVILRPEPGASATSARAVAIGLHPRSAPLFVIEPVPWSLPTGHFDAILATSANGIALAGDGIAGLTHLPLYAVGPATAAAAKAAGFTVAHAGDGGVERLIRTIDPALRLLHLAGEDRTIVETARPTVDAITVYRARAVESVQADALAGAVVLVHSPRAGARLAEIASDRSATVIVAISEAAAHACGAGWEAIEVAERPDDRAMLALAARLCDKPGQG